MNEGVLRGLSRVLRLQFAAVQQHFIHILLLRAWNEEAVADRITSIDAVVRGEAALPRVAAARPNALESDRQLADQCRAAANRAAAAQPDTDLAAACGQIEAWYAEFGGWRPGRALPRIDNPCADFERVLREYVS